MTSGGFDIVDILRNVLLFARLPVARGRPVMSFFQEARGRLDTTCQQHQIWMLLEPVSKDPNGSRVSIHPKSCERSAPGCSVRAPLCASQRLSQGPSKSDCGATRKYDPFPETATWKSQFLITGETCWTPQHVEKTGLISGDTDDSSSARQENEKEMVLEGPPALPEEQCVQNAAMPIRLDHQA